MAKTKVADKPEFHNAEELRIMKGLAAAVREAVLQHKRAGNPIAVWEDGKVVWVPAEEIDISAYDTKE